MQVVTPFWIRTGTQVPYPGLRQSTATCVLVSIASAVNWLAQQSLTEATAVGWFLAAGQTAVNFGSVVSVISPKVPGLKFTEYHDQINPLQNPGTLLATVRSRGVLILSLEIAAPTGTSVHRTGNWHMISVFNSAGSDAQVWDTNGYAGFLTWAEVSDLIMGNAPAIPYPPAGFLVPHAQHHCLLIE